MMVANIRMLLDAVVGVAPMTVAALAAELVIVGALVVELLRIML